MHRLYCFETLNYFTHFYVLLIFENYICWIFIIRLFELRAVVTQEYCRVDGGWGRGGEARWSGQKIGHKINSIQSVQNAVCCLAVIFHEGLPCGVEWVRSPREGATMEPFTEPPVPRTSIHTSSFIPEKKPGGTFAMRKDWGIAKLSRHQVFPDVTRDWVFLVCSIEKINVLTFNKINCIK